jgi:hypothetical protein
MELVPTPQLPGSHILATDHMLLKCAVDVSVWFHTTLRLKSVIWLKLWKVDADGTAIP